MAKADEWNDAREKAVSYNAPYGTKEQEKRIKTETEEKKKKTTGYRGGRGGGGSSGGGVAVTVSIPAAGNYAQAQEDPYWETMRGWYESAYAAALQESEAAAERASQAAQQEAERAGRALRDEYAGLDRQLYRDYMEHRRTLPQSLAARGYTGGVSESAELRLRNGYEEAMAENTRSRLRRQGELDDTLAAAEEKARAEDAERRAQASRELQQGIAALLRERHSETHADDLRRAQTLAAAGDFSGYRALGWSEGEIGYLSAIWAAKNPELAAVTYSYYA